MLELGNGTNIHPAQQTLQDDLASLREDGRCYRGRRVHQGRRRRGSCESTSSVNLTIELHSSIYPVVQEISEFAGIRAMPTFIAYKKGEPIKTVTGAKPAELKVSIFAMLCNISGCSRAERRMIIPSNRPPSKPPLPLPTNA